jgi:hypothetical protein
MKTVDKTVAQTDDDNILDDYSHLPFKRAGNRFAKYRNARIFVIDDNGEEHELIEEPQTNLIGQSRNIRQ